MNCELCKDRPALVPTILFDGSRHWVCWVCRGIINEQAHQRRVNAMAAVEMENARRKAQELDFRFRPTKQPPPIESDY